MYSDLIAFISSTSRSWAFQRAFIGGGIHEANRLKFHCGFGVLTGNPKAVDAADRSHHNQIAPLKQRAGRRVAQHVDLFIDRGCYGDVGLSDGHIGLGLLVVVVGDEVFNANVLLWASTRVSHPLQPLPQCPEHCVLHPAVAHQKEQPGWIAVVLNVPLNHDLNHRFFEVMAAGVPQVMFGDPGLVGEHRHQAERPDVFWASSIDELEALVLRLFAEPARLRAIPVAPPPYWELKDLL